MISKAYWNRLEIPSVFLSRATVGATFVPWLWASVNMRGLAAIISALGAEVAVGRSARAWPLCAGISAVELIMAAPQKLTSEQLDEVVSLRQEFPSNSVLVPLHLAHLGAPRNASNSRHLRIGGATVGRPTPCPRSACGHVKIVASCLLAVVGLRANSEVSRGFSDRNRGLMLR